jgi:large conductance mechanosensitive channel
MGLVKEFKEFAVRGNVADMAIGVVIGAAFGKVVSSLVTDVVMPPLGVIVGGVDFRDLALEVRAASDGRAAVVLRYGSFLQAISDFLVVAVAVFAVVKLLNRLKREAPAGPSGPPRQETLLEEIRDALRNRNH